MRISLSLRALAVLAAGALLVAPAAAQPYGAHSMLSVTSPPAVKDAMFRSAARLHLTTIRVDVELQGIVLTDVWRDWHGLDEYRRALAPLPRAPPAGPHGPRPAVGHRAWLPGRLRLPVRPALPRR